MESETSTGIPFDAVLVSTQLSCLSALTAFLPCLPLSVTRQVVFRVSMTSLFFDLLMFVFLNFSLTLSSQHEMLRHKRGEIEAFHENCCIASLDDVSDI